MAASITVPTAPPSVPFALQNLSPIVLSYLETISSGKRRLSTPQLAELSQHPHDNKFLKYMSSPSSNASDPTPPTDLSYPLSSYFINTSHNTYLTGNQLYSESSTDAYRNVLLRGCRCIEIDVWDGEPKSGSVEAEGNPSDEKKHRFRPHIPDSLASHGPFKHFYKDSTPAPSATGTSETLSMPTPWTSTSTEMRAEPRVLHGHTLTKEVPFRDVCEVIRETAFISSDLPLIVSLEVHANAEQQEIMVEIINSTWKGYLVPLPSSDCTALPSPGSLRHKILVKVKASDQKKTNITHAKDETSSASHVKSNASSSTPSEDEDTKTSSDLRKKKKKSSITPSLSALGIYTRGYHFHSFRSPEATIPTHVFALSEKKLMEIHTSSGPTLFGHNRNFMMRAYPSGMRVRSDNLDPAIFWRKGVQLVALNCQRWDEGMMLNEGMFVGSGGWVLKPEGYRGERNASPAPAISTESQADAIVHKTLTLSIEVLAAQDIPLPIGNNRPDSLHPYVKCELHVEKTSERTGAPIEGGGRAREGEYKWKSRTMKGINVDFGGERAEFAQVPGVAEELSFLRFKIQDDKIGKDDLAAWACIRLDRLRHGFRFVHLLDAAGEQSKGVLLVGIEKQLV